MPRWGCAVHRPFKSLCEAWTWDVLLSRTAQRLSESLPECSFTRSGGTCVWGEVWRNEKALCVVGLGRAIGERVWS